MIEISQLQIEIKETLEEYEQLHNISSHIEEIDSQLKAAYSKIKTMDSQLDKELNDIEQLEKIGVKSLFYKTLGNKEEQLEKERQEYLELSLKYNAYKKEVEVMQYERDLLSKKLNNLPKIKERLESLKQKRENEIMNSGNVALRNEFSEILHKLDVQIVLSKELIEAIEEGEKAKKYLRVIISHLSKAEDWGRWDMSSNDRRAKYIKQQSIEQAIRILPNAQHQLNIFMRELRDLENNIVLKLDTIHFNKFRDFFFDNLISDWIIQQRIRSTLSNIEATHSHVQRIMLSLSQEQKSVNESMIQLNNQKDKLIIS